jgi:hypothetical protein
VKPAEQKAVMSILEPLQTNPLKALMNQRPKNHRY